MWINPKAYALLAAVYSNPPRLTIYLHRISFSLLMRKALD